MVRRIGASARRRRYGAIAAALAAHLALLGAMGLGLLSREPATRAALPPPFVELDLTPSAPRPAPRAPASASPARAAPARASSGPAAPAARAARSAGPASVAPPPGRVIGAGPAGEPIGPTGPIGSQAALRASSGCESAEYLRLNPAEVARCTERNRRLWAKNPKTYAAVDPDKKDFFDGACKRDDDWCLYYKGQGPYPGLLAIGKKKKRNGW